MLIVISILGIYGITTAITSENEYYFKIEYELNNFEIYLKNDSQLNVEKSINRIREYVYNYAQYLTLYNMYNEKIMDIFNLVIKAKDENNLQYITQAKIILANIYRKEYILKESNHS